MTSIDSVELERLINQIVDSELSDVDETRLEALLRDDVAARDRYLRFMMLHADLLWDHGAAASLASAQSQSVPAVQPLASPRSKWSIAWLSPWPTVAMWLLMLGMAGGLVSMRMQREKGAVSVALEPSKMIVTLDAIHGAAEWSDGATIQHLSTGSEQRLAAGALLLEGDDSSAQLRFDDGTRVTVSGGAEVEFSQDLQKRLRLRRGSLTADVTRQPEGHPLVIETPTARVEVIGTVFSLVADSEQTALNVEQGAVRMLRLVDGQQVEVQDQRRAVASLNASAEMQVVRAGVPPDVWRQTFDQPPPAVCKGAWIARDGEQPNRVCAVPCVASRKISGVPVVHHGITARSGVETNLVTLHAGSVLRVRYRLMGEAPLRIMLGTNQPGGSFAGNFEVKRSSRTGVVDADGWRTLTVPLSEFRPLMKRFPMPQDGSQVSLIMVNSHEHDVGLEVCELGIHPMAH